MDEGKILLVNLSKGESARTARISLCALVTTLSFAAFNRAELPQVERRDFFVYLDEFQNSHPCVATWFGVAQVKVGLVLAHQTWSLEPDVRHAVLGMLGR